jgi:hypothetical protein
MVRVGLIVDGDDSYAPGGREWLIVDPLGYR